MTHGGARKGAGRKPGSATTKTRQIAEKAASEGLTPLEFMLQVLRDVTKDDAERMEAAKSAAPYIHPRLSAVDANVEGGLRIEIVDDNDDD